MQLFHKKHLENVRIVDISVVSSLFSWAEMQSFKLFKDHRQKHEYHQLETSIVSKEKLHLLLTKICRFNILLWLPASAVFIAAQLN